MSSPLSATLTLAALRRRCQLRGFFDAALAAVRRPPDWLEPLMHLGCTAAAAAAIAAGMFAATVDLLAPASQGALARLMWRDHANAVSALAASASVPATDSGVTAPAPAQIVPGEQLAELNPLIEITPAFFNGAEQHRALSRQISEPASAVAEIVYGRVTQVADAGTWIIGAQTVRLWGIRSDPRAPLPDLAAAVGQVSAGGPVECRKQPHSVRYRCLTADHEDVAELALLSGVGRTAVGATTAYKNAEARARHAGKGLWAGP